MIKKLYSKLFMYGHYPRPFQKIIGFFLGKPTFIHMEELSQIDANDVQKGLDEALNEPRYPLGGVS